jgi:hypothetical protein
MFFWGAKVKLIRKLILIYLIIGFRFEQSPYACSLDRGPTCSAVRLPTRNPVAGFPFSRKISAKASSNRLISPSLSHDGCSTGGEAPLRDPISSPAFSICKPLISFPFHPFPSSPFLFLAASINWIGVLVLVFSRSLCLMAPPAPDSSPPRSTM